MRSANRGHFAGTCASRLAPKSLGAQAPDDADAISAAPTNTGAQRLAVEQPADHRDQRNAQEIERHHDRRVAVAERIGEAEVGREPPTAMPSSGRIIDESSRKKKSDRCRRNSSATASGSSRTGSRRWSRSR